MHIEGNPIGGESHRIDIFLSCLPIVGGAIGGAFIGATFVLYLYFTKKCKKVWQQMLVCVAIAIIEVLLLALLALAFIEIVRA